ncbi:MAG: response regulator transcription factor [Anaerolineae bacterium]|jgi:DNA-binding response OmpR family regulator|nr:response regulator transcription factor [Anaerolineae bacterium]
MNPAMTATQATANILVVDDEGANRYSVRKTLERVGYMVEESASGEQALDAIKAQEFDVILTDIRMQGIDGVELLRRIKEHSPDAIVILMTGYASLGTAVEALRLGAHDYLIKPSSSVDIRQSVSRGVERARNLKRRRRLLETIKNDVFELTRADIEVTKSIAEVAAAIQPDREPDYLYQQAPEPAGSVMQLGPLTVYPGRYQISIEDRPIDLTPTEFDLLLYLAAHRGRVVPCSELVREVRGYGVDEAEAREVIRPHISNLRRKLKSAGQNADIIVNVRGIGYRLSERASVSD